MMQGKLLSFVGGLSVLVSSVALAADKQAKYVFLLIGDGMGPVQRETADLVAKSTTGKPMVMETLPVRGQIQTHAANAAITDSAAAGTALAAGVKTNNGMIGQLPDGTRIESITTKLIAAGYKTGVISSVGLNHATPGAFFGHSASRNAYSEIARQLPESGVHLVIGNGLISEDKKQDEIMAGWKDAGIVTITSLGESAPADARVVAVLNYPGATEEKKLEGPGELANSVAYAIQRLKNDRGFFIMAEGGKIDGEGHGNRAAEIIDETHAFDRAVEVAYAFYRAHPDETLVVVTADHETGGMTLHPDRFDVSQIMALAGRFWKVSAAVDKQTGLTEEKVLEVAREIVGLEALTAQEQAAIAKAIAEHNENQKGQVTRAVMAVAQARAGITWTTGGHTGIDVPVSAIGVGAENFAGSYDNTELPKKILELMVQQ